MTRDETMKLVVEILGEIAPEAELSGIPGDADLREALDLDSIDFQNFVVALHERTGWPIPETDYPMLLTLDGVAGYFASGGATTV